MAPGSPCPSAETAEECYMVVAKVCPLAVILMLVLLPANSAEKAPAYETLALQPQKPLVISGRKDQVIQGLRIAAELAGEKGDKGENVLRIDRCENLTLLCCEIGPAKKAIRVTNSTNVKILNCWIHDAPGNPGVVVESSRDVLVQGCRIERVETGVYALSSSAVKVIGNYVEDCLGPMPRGQVVQFDKVTGAGCVVADNYGMNFHGQSTPEDMISLYMSAGTADAPILIENNFLMGDPIKGSTDKSKSGSGVMLGDASGAYLTVRGNTLIAPGQVGIGICGGSHITVEKNVIWGLSSNVANVGIYVWNQSKKPGSDITVTGNTVAWWSAKGGKNSFWDGKGFENQTVKDNQWDALEYFEKHFPTPPSFEPLPPKPHVSANGAVLLPWRVTEAELAAAKAARERYETLMSAARKVLGKGKATDADFARKHQADLQLIAQGLAAVIGPYSETRYAKYCATLAEELGLPVPKPEAKKPAGGSVAATPAPATAKKGPSAAALAAWDAKLLARVKEELAAGRKPKFFMAALNEKAEIRSLDDKNMLKLASASLDMPMDWARVTLVDRKSLALSLLRKDEPADHALAAFYLLAEHDDDRAAEHLQAAGAAASDVRAAFE